MLSLTLVLVLFTQYLGCPIAPIEILCDNAALVDTVNRLITRSWPLFPNDTLAPSWDVVQCLVAHVKQLPATSTIRWIKSHQDDNIEFEKLSLRAQLNVRADELTGIAHETSDPQAFQYISTPSFREPSASLSWMTPSSAINYATRPAMSVALRQCIRIWQPSTCGRSRCLTLSIG